jgi:malate synthase
MCEVSSNGKERSTKTMFMKTNTLEAIKTPGSCAKLVVMGRNGPQRQCSWKQTYSRSNTDSWLMCEVSSNGKEWSTKTMFHENKHTLEAIQTPGSYAKLVVMGRKGPQRQCSWKQTYSRSNTDSWLICKVSSIGKEWSTKTIFHENKHALEAIQTPGSCAKLVVMGRNGPQRQCSWKQTYSRSNTDSWLMCEVSSNGKEGSTKTMFHENKHTLEAIQTPGSCAKLVVMGRKGPQRQCFMKTNTL